MKNVDVLIIGAGAAGLACAEHLTQAGARIQILEARHRIGGRAFSLENSHFTQPIEFGAEFVHGAPEQILSRLDEYHETFVDVLDEHLFLTKGRLKTRQNFWEDIQKVTDRLRKNRKADQNIHDFLKNEGPRLSPNIRKLFTSYVEGFQAADTFKMGEKALAKSENDEEGELNEQGLFRLSHGYSHFMNQFLKNKKIVKALHLGCLVHEVYWQKGVVAVSAIDNGRKRIFKASKVVITVPLSVLKSQDQISSLHFVPEIPALKEAMAHLYMGHVQRIAFDFDQRFWETLSKKQVGFLHTGPEHYFPTWWTQMPVRSSLLIAWQGGPKAEELSRMPLEERVEHALTTLSSLTKHSKQFLKKHLRGYYTHNWGEDPYALGAYSYNGLNSEPGQKRLQRPFMDTIYIAGEATATGSDQGTVHGALESGIRAARQALRSLKLTNTYARGNLRARKIELVVYNRNQKRLVSVPRIKN